MTNTIRSVTVVAVLHCTLTNALALPQSLPQFVPQYRVKYLGFAFTNGIQAKVNNQGQIVGAASSGGLIYDDGHVTSLGTLGGSGRSRPTAINDGGQVAGSSPTANLDAHAFLYSHGTLTDLGVLESYPTSSAYGLNAGGDVVGASFSPNGANSRAFQFRSGILTDLGPGIASAINVNGTIVGTSNNRAVRYENGAIHDLGSFGDSGLTSAIDINDSEQIVGRSYVRNEDSAFVAHPFLYESGIWRDLGLPEGVPLGIPSAINNVGQVVGNSNLSLGSDSRPPFLYADGTIYNLQSLLDASGQGLTLHLAYDINDHGAILAQGRNSAGYQAVLLTPVPEPNRLILIGITALFVCASRFRNSRRSWL